LQHEQSRVELSPRERRAFLLAKLHSLTGLVPVGTFVVLHLYTNAQALGGQAAFDAAVGRSNRLPFPLAVEVLGLWLPLAYHALYGLHRVLGSRPQLGAYPFARNWAYFGQRLTGVVALLFVAWHLWQLRVQVLLGQMNRSDYFQELCSRLGGTGTLGVPWFALGFLGAMAAVAFHLANGVHGFCFSWGITGSLGSSRRASAVCGLGGVALFAVGASTILYFATGWRIGSSDLSVEGAPGVTCSELSDGQRAALERTRHGAAPFASAGRGRK
jgi:succinate dehydrogenase/fumarate reductase cytochrome b subunit (b558 family)